MAAAVEVYKSNWWMFLLEGIVTLLFGIVAVANPGQTFLALAFFFGLYLVISGIITIIESLSSHRGNSGWIVSLILGALVTVLGIYLLQRPGLSLATFVTFAALALLVRGVIHAFEAFNGQYDAVFRVWHAIAAVVAVLASVFVWRYPVKGTLAFVWILGVFALINGPLLIAFSIEAKNGFGASSGRKR